MIKRVRNQDQEAIQGTHYNLEDMQRRLKTYRTANNSEVAEPSVQEFFKQQGIKYFSEEISTDTNDSLSGFKIYIERNEKPFNFMTWDEEDEVVRRNKYEAA